MGAQISYFVGLLNLLCVLSTISVIVLQLGGPLLIRTREDSSALSSHLQADYHSAIKTYKKKKGFGVIESHQMLSYSNKLKIGPRSLQTGLLSTLTKCPSLNVARVGASSFLCIRST